VAYDEALAARIRAQLGAFDDLTERRMFGGLAFLIAGHMSVTASRDGGIMVRVDPERADALLQRPGCEVMVMRGRPMDNWLRVTGTTLDDDAALADWIGEAAGYARTLTPKRTEAS
jgi:TfoX/Sxy family transcriptional regulator of competence genes